MRQIHVIFILITFNQIYALRIIKSATITPITPNLQDNAAKVTELYGVRRTPTKWTLHDPDSMQGFHLQLTLNASLWSFHPTENTTLKMELNADGFTSSRNRFTVLFSQTGTTKYFATRIDIEGTNDHRIYPPCDSLPPYPQTYLDADFISLVNAYNDGWGIYYKAVQGNINWVYQPELPASERVVESPWTFILFNDPNNKYMLFTYTNPNVIDRSCGFVQMDPNKGMDIYFAADFVTYSVNISSFIITHSYETTDAPTSDPTGTPTVNHTLHPTGDPTTNPTKVSTNNHTDNPIVIPTPNPTANSTINPTVIPTSNPISIATADPTINPTVTPIAIASKLQSSKTPSYSSTNIPSNSSTEPVNNYTSTTLTTHIDPGDKAKNIQCIIIIGSVCSVLILIIMVLIMMYIWRKRKIDATKKQKNASSLQQDKMLQNVITEMAVIEKTSDDLYDEMQSVDTIGATTTRLDGNSLFNDEQDNNMDIEAMYNPTEPTSTGNGNNIDYNNGDEEGGYPEAISVCDEGEVISKRRRDIVKSNVEHIDENIHSEDDVKDWLNQIVELPQYYDIFIKNGLNALKSIQKLNDDQQLIDLGIQLKGHRIIIMKYIKQLTSDGDSV